tara:strand:+ start:992 stop:1252 length:261 start_codon:yes stop_codon:yes gene_type:complete
MQPEDNTESNVRNAEKKEETNVLNDQERVERWLEEVNDAETEYETVQVTKHMFVKQKKNDQENIKEIIEKHPYKRWETILDGPGTK